MKKIILALCLFAAFGISGTHALSFAPIDFEPEIDDDSILEELQKSEPLELEHDVSMKSIESCTAFEDVIEEYVKSYWKYSKNRGYNVFPMRRGGPEIMMMDDAIMESADMAVSAKASGGATNDFSQTNIQVAGVDESDIIKTDGEYIYYYNETQKAILIVKAAKSGFFGNDESQLVRKINLPESFYGAQIYINEDRLVVIASGHDHNNSKSQYNYYFNRGTKTYTIIFDIQNPEKPSLLKLHSSDGNFSKSRRIGDYLYVLSTNYFNFPYYNWNSIDDIELRTDELLPKKLDITKDTNPINALTIKGKTLPYDVEAGNVADCKKISYSFPDTDTLEEIHFNPGYNIINIFDLENISTPVQTQVVAGSNTEVFMSNENLYMTEGMWQPRNYRCPRGLVCTTGFFWGGQQNTLIHKLSVDKNNLSYENSTIIPGSPLTQYSMDEHDENFRIITSTRFPEASTGLYILDKNLKPLSSLTELAPGESFQSSRFMGDKLFLVTFEQIDPLFAIDLSDDRNPKVLGELKIPGFSTYLHPYDEVHLIGLGYDTEQNQWGGVQTAGVKVDLYKINYDKKCGDIDLSFEQIQKCESGDYKGIIVEQKFTQTYGGKGSQSEALQNPRMFVWNPNKKTLLLPASLYEREQNWQVTDYYNGLLSIKIDSNSGISKVGQVTHLQAEIMQEEKEKECSRYKMQPRPQCRVLLSGEEFCEEEEKTEVEYVDHTPSYCEPGANIWEFAGNRSWSFRPYNIKRALYIGDNVYGISDEILGTYNWSMREIDALELSQ